MILRLCIILVLNIYTKQEAKIDIVALTLMYTPYTAIHVITLDCSLKHLPELYIKMGISRIENLSFNRVNIAFFIQQI